MAAASPRSGPRLHRGDFMSVATRSAVMAKINGRGTKPELAVEAILSKLGVPFEKQVRDLPGRPDFVIRDARVVVLVDGDFWHGWKFDEWRLKLSEKWEAKIAANRRRDTRNRKLLREQGWTVVRIWEHQVAKTPSGCRRRLRRALGPLLLTRSPGSLATDEARSAKPE